VLQLQTAGGRKTSARQLPGVQAREGGAAEEEITENTQDYNQVFSSNTITPGVSFAAALRGGSAQTEQPWAKQLPVVTPPTEVGSNPSPGRQQKSGQSVRAPSVNNQPIDDMLTVVTIVQQIVTEFRGAVSEKDKILAITKIVLNLMNQNGH
jgi:hypothetical protein